MNKIVEGTEELLAMRRCDTCGHDTPLYIARIADEKGMIIGTDSRTPRCGICGTEGWGYNPKVNKYPLGNKYYSKK